MVLLPLDCDSFFEYFRNIATIPLVERDGPEPLFSRPSSRLQGHAAVIHVREDEEDERPKADRA